MNTKEAKAILEKQGWKVYDDGKPEDYEKKRFVSRGNNNDKVKAALKRSGATLYRVWKQDYFYGIYTGRELVRLARDVTTDSNHFKHNLKHFDKHKNRSRQRNFIKTERFEDIPLNNGKIYKEDIWNWD